MAPWFKKVLTSGYILLGAIIEKASGQSYEQFIQQSIIEPLGMKQSYYDSPSRVIPRRVAGYDKSSQGFTNAAYLSMTQPYAAGALASTAYGYGWEISEYAGHQLIEHGGGIHGFRTRAIRIPDDRVFVAVLSNNGGVNPGLLAFKIAALAVGQPYDEPTPVVLQPEVLTRYEGVYEINSEEIYITREDNQRFFQYRENPRVELVPLSQNEFFFKEMSLDRLLFVNDANKVIIAVEVRGRTGIPEIAKKVDKSAPGTS